LYVRNVLDN